MHSCCFFGGALPLPPALLDPVQVCLPRGLPVTLRGLGRVRRGDDAAAYDDQVGAPGSEEADWHIILFKQTGKKDFF